MWRDIGISFAKIVAYLVLWACLTGLVIWAAVSFGGEDFFAKLPFRVGVEIALTFATLIPVGLLAHFVDHRRLASLGFSARIYDVLTGAIIGAAILCVPIGALLATGGARI